MNAPSSDVYLFYSPLALETFIQLAMSTNSYAIRQGVMQQAFKGLAYLHSKSIMHRDLKPTNLMIVSYDPLHVIIIDFGCATFSSKSNDHMAGTIAYLAPEVLALKSGSHKSTYDQKVDIWGMGLTGYQLFFQEPCTWRKGVGMDEWNAIKAKLNERPGILSKTLESMLAWDPADRPSASELEISLAWEQK